MAVFSLAFTSAIDDDLVASEDDFASLEDDFASLEDDFASLKDDFSAAELVTTTAAVVEKVTQKLMYTVKSVTHLPQKLKEQNYI